MITIVDYGLGNILAFSNVYKNLNIPINVATNPSHLINATKIILPGVGSFDHAMARLNQTGFRVVLDDLVLNKKIPVLGICVGMQILAHSSEEGTLPGLGWIDGVVKKFDPSTIKQSTRLPHMGWNDVVPTGKNGLLNELLNDSKFYFLHSYYFHCNQTENIIAQADYGIKFSCAVNANNVFGVQFHPEKSHQYGIQLLKNFADL